MLITLISRSFVCRQRVLVGQWPDWPSSKIVPAAVSGRSAVGPPGPRVSQTFPPPAREKLHPHEMYAGGGGLLVAPINAPHLFLSFSRYLQDRWANLHRIFQKDGKWASIEKLRFWFLNSFDDIGGSWKKVTFATDPASRNAGLHACNQLPAALRATPNLNSFKNQLKTHLLIQVWVNGHIIFILYTFLLYELL